MALIRADAVAGALSAALTTAATTMESDGLADLPEVSSPDIAKVVLYRRALTGRVTAYEVVHVTAHTAGATTATILRAQEGTSALSWIVSDRWDHAPTVEEIDALITQAAADAAYRRERRLVAPPTGVAATDRAAAMSAIADAIADPVTYSGVQFRPGEYVVNDELPITANDLEVHLTPATTIRQTVADKTIFRAEGRDNVWIYCHRGVLHGEGSWSSSWTGNSGHDDRGVQLIDCTSSGVSYPRIRNMANAGIYISGGDDVWVICPEIEGTHTYSTPLSSGDNFQNGIFVEANATRAHGRITIVCPTISGVAQGILATESGGSPGDMLIVAPVIHDIPGQHGMYLRCSNITATTPIITTTALQGFKVQAGGTSGDIQNVTVTAPRIRGASSQAFSVECSIADATGVMAVMEGIVVTNPNVDDCQRGMVVRGGVKHSRIDNFVGRNLTAQGILIDGDGLDDVTIDGYTVDGAGEHGVLVGATGTGTLYMHRGVIRRPNTSAGSFYGFHTNSATTITVRLDGMDIDDADSNMAYGLFRLGGGTVSVHGRVRIRGASTNNVRADATIAEWPTDADVEGSFTTTANIRSSIPLLRSARSTSTSNQWMWIHDLEDESAYLLRAELTGKLAGSTERAAYVTTVLAYRDAGGNAVIEGSADTDVSIASAGFAGVYAWAVSGTNVRLNVNSGGAADYDWTARITVTKVVA